MDIKEKLDMWVKLTGVNPDEDRTSWQIRLDGKLSDWDIKRMNDKLMEVVKYDVNGVYTNIYLKEYFNTFLKGKSVSFYDYLDKKNEYVDFLNICDKLKKGLYDNNNVEQTLIDETRKIINYYDIKDYELDIFDIVNIRISASINSDKLRVSQFKKGIRSSENPKYIRDIYMVNNVDKLIKTIEEKPFNCIAMNYICDKDNIASSYFTFIIKNGDNVFIMDDKPSYTHPNQKYMSRTQGRDMAERMDKTYFPYSLVNLDVGKYHVSDRNSKILDENEYVKLGSINDMEIAEALWTVNMFSLINEKFFKNSYECDELSYVGGMIKHNLLNYGKNELVIYDSYEKLELPMIEKPDELDIKYEYESSGLFSDVVDRLKDKVDINLINSVGYSDNYLLENNDNKPFWCEREKILYLNVNEYGTKEEIEYRQKWIARYNFAKQIDELAKEEYEKTNKEVNKWYVDNIKKNIDNIMDKIIHEKLKGDKIVEKDFYGISSRPADSIVRKFEFSVYRNEHSWGGNQIKIGSDDKVSIVISIYPNNVDDLMVLTGCTYDEMPDVLKSWSPWPKRHNGNCILDNLDPCDWVIEDRWYNFVGRIDIFISKTEYNNQYKKRGLEPDKFWLNKN